MTSKIVDFSEYPKLRYGEVVQFSLASQSAVIEWEDGERVAVEVEGGGRYSPIGTRAKRVAEINQSIEAA